MPNNKDRPAQVTINFQASEKLTAYLYDLIDEEGFGNTPTTVVQNLVWGEIRRQISNQIITRRPGKIPEEE